MFVEKNDLQLQPDVRIYNETCNLRLVNEIGYKSMKAGDLNRF